MAPAIIDDSNNDVDSLKRTGDAQFLTSPRQLPVTLLSGFLGSGKTTLLEHILKSDTHGLRIAVIVNDMSSLNIDASLITHHKVSQTKEKLIQLQNGCICCTLRGDLLEELARLAREEDAVEYVVIESTGISEPMQVAETFTQEFSEAMVEGLQEEGNEEQRKTLEELLSLGGLHKLARLDTTVTVVDAFNFFDNFDTSEMLSDRWGKDATEEEDERNITDLLVDQIEFADVVIINKSDTIDEKKKKAVHKVVTQLNPQAKVIESNYSKVNVQEIVNTGKFNFEKAATGAGWLQSLHEMTVRKGKLAPKPETEEYGVNSFVYRARKPFHPKRLFNLIHDKFIVIQSTPEAEDGDEEEEDDSESDRDEEMVDADDDGEPEPDDLADKEFAVEIDPKIILNNKRNHVAFKPLLRSKGFFWLATRPIQHGEWSQAGGMLTVQGGGPWFCMIERDEWPEDPEVVRSIEADFEGRWGDRRQEIVFIGLGLDIDAITKEFDHALLTSAEMKRWERVMGDKSRSPQEVEEKLSQMWEDGFEDWPDVSKDDHEGHNHG